MRAKRRNLTDAEVAIVRSLYDEGYALSDIAPRMGMKKVTLAFRLRRVGFKTRPNAEAKRMPFANAKRAASLSGPNNPMFKGDTATPNRGRHRGHALYPTAPSHCSRCGCHKSDTKRMERHHVDGDTLNNAPQNIRWLCAKCHKAVHPHPRWKTPIRDSKPKRANEPEGA